MDSLVAEYSYVFAPDDLLNLPPSRPGIDMPIDLEPDSQPLFGPIYSLSRNEELALQEYLKEASAKGIISPSRCPAGAPVMFVKKSP